MISVFKVKKDVTAIIFSYQKNRDSILIKAGEYVLSGIEYTDWRETIIICDGLLPLITKTYWGLTPFMESVEIKDIECFGKKV